MATITISGVHAVPLEDGSSITYSQSGTPFVAEWSKPGADGFPDRTALHDGLSDEQWEALRKEHPEWKLPPAKPQEKGSGDGNTKGKVQGQGPKSDTDPAAANPKAKPETPAEKGWLERNSGNIHSALGAASFVPGPSGAVAGATDAALYAWEGDWWNAGLSAMAIIPGGKLLGKLGGLAGKAGKAEKAIAEGEKVAAQGEKALTQAEKEALAKAEKEAAEKKPAPGGKVKNKQKCASLAAKIANQIKDLTEKRAEGLVNNLGKYQGQGVPREPLPFYNPYRTSPHADDILGHMLKFHLVKGELKANMAAYKELGCGPLPPGAEQAATMDIPRPAVAPPTVTQPKPNLP